MTISDIASPAATEHVPSRTDAASWWSRSHWTDDDFAAAGVPVVDVPIVSVGGGIGSFVFADLLRIAGLPTSAVAVIGPDERPWANYQHLASVSQIPAHERLRSDSSSTPDNIWAFPSYAIREAAAARGWRRVPPLWNVLTEPLLEDYYTPRSGQVFAAMEREAVRIGYAAMFRRGHVRSVRRRESGGYFTLVSDAADRDAAGPAAGAVAYRSRHVHLALGYPGLRLLPDVRRYREQHPDDDRVVNAYEPHDQVYARCARRASTVLVRGSGIAASRVLQKLLDDRARHGMDTTVVHVFRTYVATSHGTRLTMRRRGGNGFAYQGFNWPKATWGGQLKARIERLEGAERKQFYEMMDGTTTASRERWMTQLDSAREAGHYRQLVGTVELGGRLADGGVRAVVHTDRGPVEIDADALIDATGLEPDVREHQVVADLLDYGCAGLNPLGRLDVSRHFEVRGTRNDGRLYAVGAATLGAYFAPVDTFLGLQYAALQVCDDLAAQRVCPRIGMRSSVSNWLRWTRNVAPAVRP